MAFVMAAILSWRGAAFAPPTFGRALVSRQSYGDKVASIPRFGKRCLSSRSTLSMSSAAATTATKSSSEVKRVKKRKIPITLLSGFLGSGKTTTLKHLLENSEGIRVGVIVNDVASVNIDAKLVSSVKTSSNTTLAGDMIELQNGCACCSLADELITSVEQLLKRDSNKEKSSRPLDALVVELSGVADPMAIKGNWNSLKLSHPQPFATKRADIKKVVTLVDACTFGTDWMTLDTAGNRWKKDFQSDTACSGERQVAELLADQIEAANVVIVNKADLAGSEQLQIASDLVKAMNKNATVHACEFGEVSPWDLLGGKLNKIKQQQAEAKSSSCGCGAKKSCGGDKSSHSHSHDHDHDSTTTTSLTDPDFIDDNAAGSHSHSHKHATSTDALGIDSFVYKRDRPFHLQRLYHLIQRWPIPIKQNLDAAAIEAMKVAQRDGLVVDDAGTIVTSPFMNVLRSKGFVWISPNQWQGEGEDAYRHDQAMYWSHAGKHFGMSGVGRWWASVSREEMRRNFASQKDYEKVIRDDFVTEEWGDRRQEIVFIGPDISEEKITKALDDCLLTDREMRIYRKEAIMMERAFAEFEQRVKNGEISLPPPLEE